MNHVMHTSRFEFHNQTEISNPECENRLAVASSRWVLDPANSEQEKEEEEEEEDRLILSNTAPRKGRKQECSLSCTERRRELTRILPVFQSLDPAAVSVSTILRLAPAPRDIQLPSLLAMPAPPVDCILRQSGPSPTCTTRGWRPRKPTRWPDPALQPNPQSILMARSAMQTKIPALCSIFY
jgi:hypothetical protein